MNIAVLGAGYVGLVTSACLAQLGHHVTCVDIDERKIARLQQGDILIHEPGLPTLVKDNLHTGRLRFTTDLEQITPQPHVFFIAVGTPSSSTGAAEVKYVLAAARMIAAYITQACIIVDKSTVPVGMAYQVDAAITDVLTSRNKTIHFEVVSNPEFLREGAAIEDFMRPDRIILGLSTDHAKRVMLELFSPIMRHPELIYFMSVKDAEMAKYAANAMLATRISFMNELSQLCDKLGVDIENVRLGIGSDSRIGHAFLNAGCGYGGSCFPKDVRALISMAQEQGIDPLLLKAVEQRNELQKHILAHKLLAHFGGDLQDKTIAVWGLSFKPDTDDMREAPAVTLIQQLLTLGALIKAYDPVAMSTAATLFADHRVQLVANQYAAVEAADALVLVTEWNCFLCPDFVEIKALMRHPYILDGRNQYNPQLLNELGFYYDGIGREQLVKDKANDKHFSFA